MKRFSLGCHTLLISDKKLTMRYGNRFVSWEMGRDRRRALVKALRSRSASTFDLGKNVSKGAVITFNADRLARWRVEIGEQTRGRRVLRLMAGQIEVRGLTIYADSTRWNRPKKRELIAALAEGL